MSARTDALNYSVSGAYLRKLEERAEAAEADLNETRSLLLKATDDRRLRAAEAEADRLKAALTEYNLRRVFWKHTVDADLNTDEGCIQAAKAVVAYIAALAPADRNTA